MRRLRGILTAVPLAWLLAACNGGEPTYVEPLATNPGAATITVGTPAEQYSVSQNVAVLQIAAVDGRSTGNVPAVRVSSGEHRITVRHFDGYGTIYGNIRYADVEFTAKPGGRYRIDGSFCCGFYLGQFDLVAVDEESGEEIAHTLPASQVRLTQ
jgi:hypothetical protein